MLCLRAQDAVNVFTNLLVSAQFIQFINLDYEKTDRTCTGQPGLNLSTNPPSPAAAPYTFDCSKYTGDFATLSLDNGMKRGYRTKEWFSLFLSKPFGENQLGRWNNIIIYEEGGGYWNRLDAEYTLSDQLIVAAEITASNSPDCSATKIPSQRVFTHSNSNPAASAIAASTSR